MSHRVVRQREPSLTAPLITLNTSAIVELHFLHPAVQTRQPVGWAARYNHYMGSSCVFPFVILCVPAPLCLPCVCVWQVKPWELCSCNLSCVNLINDDTDCGKEKVADGCLHNTKSPVSLWEMFPFSFSGWIIFQLLSHCLSVSCVQYLHEGKW